MTRFRWLLAAVALLFAVSMCSDPPDPPPDRPAVTITTTTTAPTTTTTPPPTTTESYDYGTADVDVPRVDIDRPRSCSHRWWC